MNEKLLYFKTAMTACVGNSLFNGTLLYSLFVNPLFPPMITLGALLPSLYLNFVLINRYYAYFNSGPSYVVNMFLKPNGKQVIVETRDGDSKVVNTMDFY